MRLTVDGVDPEEVLRLKQALQNAYLQIQALAGANETLKKKNSQLQEENEELKKTITRMVPPEKYKALLRENQRLQKQVEKLRKENKCLRERIGEGQGWDIARPENLATSPGETMSGSFGQFGFHNG